MLTYQDLLACGQNEQARTEFIYAAIADHEGGDKFKIGQRSGLFYRHHDPNIENYEKIIYDSNGIAHKDEISPNHKIMANFYQIFIDQFVEYQLGNGVSFENAAVKERLGNQFDHDIKKVLRYAANDGEAYALVTESTGIVPFCIACQLDGDEPYFIPLRDEDDGSIKAGIRYWRLAPDKPLRATLYELDGFTEYKEYTADDKPNLAVLDDKRAYKVESISNDSEGEYISVGTNYNELPIVRMGFINNQSSIVGNEGALTGYNMILSGFANQVDWDILYWAINNADGMNETDDANFLIDLLKTHVLHMSGEASATPHQIIIQHEARKVILDELRDRLFEDFQAVDTRKSSANMTATEIRSAYNGLNRKCDMIEAYLDEFIRNVLKLLGFDNEVWHYQRAVEINQTEAINNAIAAAPFMGDEATTKTICEIEGKTDEFESIQQAKIADDLGGLGGENDVDIADSIAEKVITAIKDFFGRFFKGDRSVENDEEAQSTE